VTGRGPCGSLRARTSPPSSGSGLHQVRAVLTRARGDDVRRLRAGEEGALAPAFLLFVVSAVAGLFFFLQLGHATVLARGASTAADAAALAAANTYRDAWGQYVSWYRRCMVPEGLGGSCPEGSQPPLPAAGPCPTAARDAAAAYAARNDAALTDCWIDGVSLSDGITVTAVIRGLTGPIDGPSDALPTRRPNAQATARVPVPPGVAQVLALIDSWIEDIEDVLDDDSCDEVVPSDPDEGEGEDDDEEEPCEPPSLPSAPPGLDDLIDEVHASTIVRLIA
jgi:hypothetical protein